MGEAVYSDAFIRDFLGDVKRIAVVGASPSPSDATEKTRPFRWKLPVEEFFHLLGAHDRLQRHSSSLFVFSAFHHTLS